MAINAVRSGKEGCREIAILTRTTHVPTSVSDITQSCASTKRKKMHTFRNQYLMPTSVILAYIKHCLTIFGIIRMNTPLCKTKFDQCVITIHLVCREIEIV